MATLHYYQVRTRSQYSHKRFMRVICKCAVPCDTAVDIYDPIYQEVLFTLCHNRAVDFGFGLLRLVGIIQRAPDPRTSDRMKIDKRCLNRSWTKGEEKELVALIENGVKNGDFSRFATLHGKTRDAVKGKAAYMKRKGIVSTNTSTRERGTSNGTGTKC